jgi:hypothetical protein
MSVPRCPSVVRYATKPVAWCTRSRLGGLVALIVVLCSCAGPGLAQQRPYHYFQSADAPPGAIGAAQLMRGGPLPGYFQPVQITGPEGLQIALAHEGVFEPPQDAPLLVGLLVGHVYRLKITNIPLQVGQELFPSIEVINRLYPPPGSEGKFPIPIELTREELEMALRGMYVVRVIYLEHPALALPTRQSPLDQRYFEVGPQQDPLEVADSLGRPMAILRIGSRVPELDEVSGRFLFESPPWFRVPVPVEPTEAEPGGEPADGVQPAGGASHPPALPAVGPRAAVREGATR